MATKLQYSQREPPKEPFNAGREGAANRSEVRRQPSASRRTQEWIEEARRMVATGSPSSRRASPARFAGTPRFAAALQARNRPPPFPPAKPAEEAHRSSGSVRRSRSQSISDEILQRSTARYSRSGSSSFPFVREASPLSFTERLSPPRNPHEGAERINTFLRRQRVMIGKVSAKFEIVLSSSTPSASSMAAVMGYAWLLENTMGSANNGKLAVVPVINMRRKKMWEHKQASWLFHHLGIDASALLFSDELDLEGLIMGKQLCLNVVGQDVLQTKGEVGSLCTILTDNYCEDAYDLLQNHNLRNLLLAGILLDTQNLSTVVRSFTSRDAEAVQLLLVGSSLDYRDSFYEQMVKEHQEESFIKYMENYFGKLSIEVNEKPQALLDVRRVAVQSAPAIPPTPLKVTEKPSRGKNKFSLSRLFGK